MEKNTVQSLDRAFDIIEALATSARGTTLTELATTTRLHKTTVYRILSSLVARGYVTKDTESGQYRLTMRFLEVSSHAVAGMDILSIARPHLERLAEMTAEVVHLVVRDDYEIVYLFKGDSSLNITRMSSYVGLRNPMYCTALGKAILAQVDRNEVARIWKRSHIEQFTPNTIVTLDQLYAHLDLVRERHYAIDNEEHEQGIRCIGSAIFNYQNEAIGAISVSGPTIRMDDARIALLVPIVLSTAERITSMLGRPPAASKLS